MFSPLQNDPGYNRRMVGISNYLLKQCDFRNTLTHANSFAQHLFTQNLRGTMVWSHADLKHKRPGCNYHILREMPEIIKTWVLDERSRHAEIWRYQDSREESMDKARWLSRFRRALTDSVGIMFDKTAAVSFICKPFTFLFLSGIITYQFREQYDIKFGNIWALISRNSHNLKLLHIMEIPVYISKFLSFFTGTCGEAQLQLEQRLRQVWPTPRIH